MDSKKTDRRGAPKGSRKGTKYEGRTGNLPHIPTSQSKAMVRAFVVAAGQEFTAIKLGISTDTLQRHYRYEIDIAEAEAVAEIGKNLFMKARGGDGPSIRFFLISRGRGAFSPKVKAEFTGANGAPIEFNLAGMSLDQKQALLPVLDQLLAASGASQDDDAE